MTWSAVMFANRFPPTPWASLISANARSSGSEKKRSADRFKMANSSRSNVDRDSGKILNQVFQHGAQSAGDLDALAAEMANFGDGQANKVLPIGSAIDESEPTVRVMHMTGIQITTADIAQEMMNLINGEHGGGRVVDRG